MKTGVLYGQTKMRFLRMKKTAHVIADDIYFTYLLKNFQTIE